MGKKDLAIGVSVDNAREITDYIVAKFAKHLDAAKLELANDSTINDTQKYLYLPCTPTFSLESLSTVLMPAVLVHPPEAVS